MVVQFHPTPVECTGLTPKLRGSAPLSMTEYLSCRPDGARSEATGRGVEKSYSLFERGRSETVGGRDASTPLCMTGYSS